MHVLHSCALLSSSVRGIEVLQAWGLGLSSSAPCPGHCAGPPGISCSLMPSPPHTYLAVNLAHAICHQETSHPFQLQGRGMQGEDSHMEGARGHVCPTPASPETKPRILLTPPVLFLLPPQSHQASGPHGGQGQGRGLGGSEATETAPPLHLTSQGCSSGMLSGSRFKSCHSREIDQKLPRRTWFSLFLIFNKTNPGRCIRFVSVRVCQGWPALLCDRMKEDL